MQLIIDNPEVCNFNDSLPAGTSLAIKGEVINQTIVSYLAQKGLKPSTAVEVPANSTWILATGNWNDSGTWDDLAQWDDGYTPPYILPGPLPTE